MRLQHVLVIARFCALTVVIRFSVVCMCPTDAHSVCTLMPELSEQFWFATILRHSAIARFQFWILRVLFVTSCMFQTFCMVFTDFRCQLCVSCINHSIIDAGFFQSFPRRFELSSFSDISVVQLSSFQSEARSTGTSKLQAV